MPYKNLRKRKQFQRAYYRKNKKKLLEYARDYNKKHVKQHRRRAKLWRKNNPEKYQADKLRQTRRTQERKNAQVATMLLQQKNRCDLCGEKFTKANPPVRDHCHRTNQWRALLHNSCNFGIGHFYDSPELCIKAAKYLRKWQRLLSQSQSQKVMP